MADATVSKRGPVVFPAFGQSVWHSLKKSARVGFEQLQSVTSLMPDLGRRGESRGGGGRVYLGEEGASPVGVEEGEE